MNRYASKLLSVVLLFATGTIFGMTSNNSFDPFPIYSAINPNEFLHTRAKEIKQGNEPMREHEYFNFSVTPFGQRSRRAKNIDQEEARLGDMYGLWNMLALTTTCPGSSTLGTHLLAASEQVFADTVESGTPIYFGDENALTYTHVLCCVPTKFGKVSVPGEYRKYGARFETSVRLFSDFGVKAQFGVSDIQFTVTAFEDAATASDCASSDCDDENQRNAERLLTSESKVKDIAAEIGLDIKNYHKTAFEDVRLSLFWRHAFAVNKNRDGWTKFLLIPFAQVTGTIASGEEPSPSTRFAVPHGNNGHHSIGIETGFILDFKNMVEIGIRAGGTMFADKTICNMRIPTDSRHSGIFPCTTDACVSPGSNWHFIFSFHAHHFLRRLSFLLQYMQVNHDNDTITVSNTNYLPSVLEDLSKWNQRHIVTSLNYDLSPNSALGLLWQAPISSHRNSPRIAGLYGTLSITF